MEERWGYNFFSSKIFCLTVPKNSVGEPFNVSKKLGFHNNLCIRRANHYFPLNLFGLTVPRKICLSKKFWYRIFSCIGGKHHGFIENFWFHMTEKFR